MRSARRATCRRSRSAASASTGGRSASLWEALTLERPFRAPTREGLFREILEGESSSLAAVAPSLPADLSVVLATALERDLERRYRTAEELAHELRRVRLREPIHARPASTWLRLSRFCQRNPALAASGTAAFLLLVVALAVTGLWLRTSEESRSSLVELSGELEAKNVELAAALDDARAGRLSKREARVRALVEEGFATFFSGHWQGADAPFREALAEEPGNVQALAGLFWYELYVGGDALGVLERHGHADPGLTEWMRGVWHERRGDGEAAAACFARAQPQRTDVQAYLEGLRAVRQFDPTPGADAARASLPHFERAIRLASRPQLAYWHGLMMAASRAGEREVVDRAAEALEHHWPDAPTTLDAVAQFYFQADPERSLAAMRRQAALTDSGMPRIGIARHALREGDVATARARLEEATRVDPELPAAWFMLATFLLDEDEPSAAVEPALRGVALEEQQVAFPLGLLRRALEGAGDERAALSDDELVELARGS